MLDYLEVGTVGCKLLYLDNTIKHAGLILGINGIPGQSGLAGHSHHHLLDAALGYYGKPHVIQNLSAVTAACVMIRKDVFNEVGGTMRNLRLPLMMLIFTYIASISPLTNCAAGH